MLALGICATVLRLLFVTLWHTADDYIVSDMAAYDRVARVLVSGLAGPWDTLWPAGYPSLLALLYRAGGGAWHVGVFQALMSGATCVLVYDIGRTLGLRRPLATLAGVLFAVHVPSVLYTGFLLTETTFAFLLTLGIWSVVRLRATTEEHQKRAWAIGAGLALGAATAVRPNLLLSLPPLAALLLFDGAPGRRRLATVVGPFVLAAALLPGLASIQQGQILGTPTGISTNGGINFFLNFGKVGGVLYEGVEGSFGIRPVPNGLAGEPIFSTDEPLYRSAVFFALGFDELWAHPGRLIGALGNGWAVVGLGQQTYWPGWEPVDRFLIPHTRVFFLFGILPALLGLLGSLRPRDRERLLREAPLWLALTSCVVAGYAFLGDIRVRIPYDPLLIVLSCLAAERLIDRTRGLPAED